MLAGRKEMVKVWAESHGKERGKVGEIGTAMVRQARQDPKGKGPCMDRAGTVGGYGHPQRDGQADRPHAWPG